MLATLFLFALIQLLPVNNNIIAVSAVISSSDKEILKRTMPIYALAEVSSKNDIFTDLPTSFKCREQLKIFQRAIDVRELWALKVLDASGTPKSGFVYGNNYWLGMKSQCLDAVNKRQLVLRENFMKNVSRLRVNDVTPFDVRYCVAHLRHNATTQYHVRLPNEDLVILGLCLPLSCSTREIGVMLREIFRERILIFSELYSADLRLVRVKDLNDDDNEWLFTKKFFVFGSAVLSILAMMIIGTVYDVTTRKKRFAVDNEDTEIVETTKLNDENIDGTSLKKNKPIGVWGKTLLCFSVKSNAKLLLSTRTGSESVLPIHGLRFISMAWIVMIHTVYYVSDYVDNKAYSWRLTEGFLMQIVSNSTFSVDTFFFLSGFLLAYTYTVGNSKKIKRRKSKIDCKKLMIVDFFSTVARRFLRITPTYLMMLFFVQFSSSWYDGYSQFFSTERLQETCEKYWWRNVLYVNNLYGRETMCMSWSWYLSNDMQFFVIGDLLLILSSLYFTAAIAILLFLLFASIFTTGYIVYANGYVPTMDEQFHTLDLLYDPPWTRIGPYVIGILTAFIVVKLNKKLNVQRRTLAIGWLLSSVCNLTVLFGLYDKQLSVSVATIYVSLSRNLWAIGIAWTVVACCTGHGGIVNNILCFKAWIPLSRLTYCAYLLNPFLINLIYLLGESARHMDFLPNFITFLGNLVLTYCCSFVLSLMLETPTVLFMRTFMSVKKYR